MASKPKSKGLAKGVIRLIVFKSLIQATLPDLKDSIRLPSIWELLEASARRMSALVAGKPEGPTLTKHALPRSKICPCRLRRFATGI
jgi:hypothetical protein